MDFELENSEVDLLEDPTTRDAELLELNQQCEARATHMEELVLERRMHRMRRGAYELALRLCLDNVQKLLKQVRAGRATATEVREGLVQQLRCFNRLCDRIDNHVLM